MYRSPERLFVTAGSVIYADGESASCAYLLLVGSVDLQLTTAEGPPTSMVRRTGEIFGDLALVDDSPRRATAVALEDCELLPITREHIADRIEAVDPLLRLVFGRIVARYSELARPLPAASHLLQLWTAQAGSARETLSFEHQLRLGIDRGELDLHFQPIVELASGRLAGFEALVRWQHPERGLLLPGAFIPFAEATGIVSDITTLCLRGVAAALPALREAAALNAAVARRLFVSVNVSGVDLEQSAFAARTVSILCDAGVDPEDVRLEVTESILMEDPERCARTLQNCRDQGLTIAIDDFGRGYSSLHYLNMLPISVIKMDQSFCHSLLSDTAGRKIIGAILHLGRELGLSVIAEGVERTAQRDLLEQMGCDYGQGYLFGAARGRQDTLALVREWRAHGANDRVVPPAA